MKKKVRINKEKFFDFIAGVAAIIAVDACFIALILKL